VHRLIMGGLARSRKGILLFHDIQPSTARALPALLADLKAKGYRIVHMRAKAPVATVAEFDSVVQSAAEKRAATSGGPLRRAVTWTVPLPPELAAPKEDTSAQGQGLSQGLGQATPGQKPGEPATPTRAPKRGATEEDWKAGILRSY
jgi:peptidoglycan-N-acetylglucosamine deacetylase